MKVHGEKRNSIVDTSDKYLCWFLIAVIGIGLLGSGWALCYTNYKSAIEAYVEPVPSPTPGPEIVYDKDNYVANVAHRLNIPSMITKDGTFGKIHLTTDGGINNEEDCLGNSFSGTIEISPSSCSETTDQIKGPYIDLTDDQGNELILTAKGIIRHKHKAVDNAGSQ